jgi:hypothetical protein
MYSRVTQLDVDTLRYGIDEALEIYEREIVPRLHEQEDYAGAYVLMTPEGRALLITFWETEEAAQATPLYLELISTYATLYRSPPGRESYEVRYADAPLVAV